jgi:hypothetical protein
MNNQTSVLNDAALDKVSGGGVWNGAELSMIELQSLVSKRATALQLTTGMMRSIHDSTKGIAGNIGR